jgi:hypothetical protein
MNQVFKLRFPPEQIPRWAARYSFAGEPEIVEIIAPEARKRGFLEHEELCRLARWKSPRSKSRVAGNDPQLVHEVTHTALAANREEIRIGLLLVLDGVGWPTASVILHLCSHEDYPILDFRALWSLRCNVPSQYTFPFWSEYTRYLRQLKQATGFGMRTIDRALWQYSKERQGRARAR